MTKEDVFNAWVGAMSMYGAFFSLVAREVGMEKALKMHAAGAEPFGDRMGKALKDELGGKKISIDALLKMRSPMMASYGMEPEIEKGPNSVTMRIPKCPMYEGFKTAGLDPGTIEKMCKAQAEMEYAGLNKHFPELEGKAKFRESPKGACVEEFRIK